VIGDAKQGADFLGELLPLSARATAGTVRNRTMKVGKLCLWLMPLDAGKRDQRSSHQWLELYAAFAPWKRAIALVARLWGWVAETLILTFSSDFVNFSFCMRHPPG
jgi:hypothetical protein